MYISLAKRHNVKLTLLEKNSTNKGLRQATVKLTGKNTYLFLHEGGAHRLQHKTSSRKKDRIHTSVATVAVLPIQTNQSQGKLDQKDLKVERMRGSGPGGQHRNKTETAVRITHTPTGVSAMIDGRSQTDNHQAALELVQARIAAKNQAQSDQSRQQLRKQQTIAERAHAVRTYDLVTDTIRDDRLGKIKQAKKILKGKQDIFAKGN
jgi:peptide chain release factor 1